VIGYPVGHSRSPLIHNYWLDELGIDGEYSKLEVAPHELAAFIGSLARRDLAGCNVTLPHKEAAFRLVRVEDEATRRQGAVNTIFIERREPVGINTDGCGFIANLEDRLPGLDLSGATVLILGAGGAARAIAGALLDEGVKRIVLANRTLERAQALRQALGAQIQPLSWEDIEDRMPEANLLINTTSLGMEGKPDLVVSLSRLPPQAAVCDIVYVPVETALLRQARDRGHVVVDGLGMLLHQARPAFERWFGVRPVITPALRRLLEDDIRRTSKAPADRP
jgi:shikimate dehydrogenase